MNKRQHGFTLIELSIVIVIIGLLIGGVIAGRSLIRSSQLQAVIGESQMYVGAVKLFKDKYKELPGDMVGARPAGWVAVAGDGDGVINIDTDLEHIYAWSHLGGSGFINGNYTGASLGGACALDTMPNINAPASRLNGARWNIGEGTGGTDYFGNPAKDAATATLLWIGGIQQAGCIKRQQPLITAIDAYILDKKNDDGFNDSGKIRGQVNVAGTSCYNADATVGNYNLAAADNLVCSLVFIFEP